MTRLVVTADAEADTSDILTYLEEKAGPPVAAKYGHRFRLTLQRVVEMPETGERHVLRLARTSALRSSIHTS
jgi:plasmid stabilization system protein ParE